MTLPPIPNQQTDFPGWLDWKRPFIGGNDLVTLMGKNDHQDLAQLYDRIVHGIIDEKTANDLRFLRWRADQEGTICNHFADDTGAVLTVEQSQYHPDNPRVIQSIDRRMAAHHLDPEKHTGPGTFEAKSRSPFVFGDIKRGGKEATWWQVQHYLLWGDLWGVACEVNVDTGEPVHVTVTADKDIHRLIMQRITDFLDRCDRRDRPTSPAEKVERLPDCGGELTTMQNLEDLLVVEFKELGAAVLQAKDIKKQATEFEKAVTGRLKAWMLLNNIDVVEGFGCRIYNREQAGKLSLDKKALVREHPKVDLSQFEKRGTPFRTLKAYRVETDDSAGEQRAINAAAID